MEVLNNLKEIKEIYLNGGNLIKFISAINKKQINSLESILISYDFQAGKYIEKSKLCNEFEIEFAKKFVYELNKFGDFDSILEIGIGEATTFVRIINELKNNKKYYGFDISWSRIKFAQEFIKSKQINDVFLFVGDLFNIPLLDNSIDFVYTSHSLEPNGGKEREALLELYRITNKYLFLFEPSSEFADEETLNYIKLHGYVENLLFYCQELGFNIIEHKLINNKNPFSPNNTGLIVIKKDTTIPNGIQEKLACPITKTPLKLIRDNYYSEDSLLLYPVVDKIPILLPNNAIVATHYLDDFSKI